MDIEPEVFNLQVNQDKSLIFAKMLKDLKGVKDKNGYYTVYRPLINKVGNIYPYELTYLLNKYPNGEEFKFNVTDIDKDYHTLYYFKLGYCMDCYGDTLLWEIGDKRFLYYCTECTEEKNFFCKHCRYD